MGEGEVREARREGAAGDYAQLRDGVRDMVGGQPQELFGLRVEVHARDSLREPWRRAPRKSRCRRGRQRRPDVFAVVLAGVAAWGEPSPAGSKCGEDEPGPGADVARAKATPEGGRAHRGRCG